MHRGKLIAVGTRDELRKLSGKSVRSKTSFDTDSGSEMIAIKTLVYAPLFIIMRQVSRCDSGRFINFCQWLRLNPVF